LCSPRYVTPLLSLTDPPPTHISTLSLHDALPISTNVPPHNLGEVCDALVALIEHPELTVDELMQYIPGPDFPTAGFICGQGSPEDRKSTRLNSSHEWISYAVFCLKKKNKYEYERT